MTAREQVLAARRRYLDHGDYPRLRALGTEVWCTALDTIGRTRITMAAATEHADRVELLFWLLLGKTKGPAT